MMDDGPVVEPGITAVPSGWATAAVITGVMPAPCSVHCALLPVLFVAVLAFALRAIVRWMQRRLRGSKLASVICHLDAWDALDVKV